MFSGWAAQTCRPPAHQYPTLPRAFCCCRAPAQPRRVRRSGQHSASHADLNRLECWSWKWRQYAHPKCPQLFITPHDVMWLLKSCQSARECRLQWHSNEIWHWPLLGSSVKRTSYHYYKYHLIKLLMEVTCTTVTDIVKSVVLNWLKLQPVVSDFNNPKFCSVTAQLNYSSLVTCCIY